MIMAVIYNTRNSTPNKRNRPWFDNECQKAIKLRGAALKKFNREADKVTIYKKTAVKVDESLLPLVILKE